jgi:hypothetical protein
MIFYDVEERKRGEIKDAVVSWSNCLMGNQNLGVWDDLHLWVLVIIQLINILLSFFINQELRKYYKATEKDFHYTSGLITRLKISCQASNYEPYEHILYQPPPPPPRHLGYSQECPLNFSIQTNSSKRLSPLYLILLSSSSIQLKSISGTYFASGFYMYVFIIPSNVKYIFCIFLIHYQKHKNG